MDYSDGPVMVPRPCDRCGAGNIEYLPEDNKITNALCAEVQLAFGLIAWLCHDCRKHWHVFIKNHPSNRHYMIVQLELEFWKARIGPFTPIESLEDGKRLINIVEDLENRINEIANEWMITA
jgi:hypothetical protein